MTIQEWAAKHQISADAVTELRALLVGPCDELPKVDAKENSEAALQQRARIESSKLGWRLWRNNVGAGKLDSGSFVRFGLANDSAAINKTVKSADLIGVRPVLILPEHVGTTVGQFVSCEVKHAGWKYSGTDRERAQLRWIEILTGLGADAKFYF